MPRFVALFSCLLLALLAGGVIADESTGIPDKRVGCPDAKLFSGKLISDICWECIFPIKTAGKALFKGESDLPGDGSPPEAANSSFLCACDDELGIPQPGFLVSMWEPAYVFEVVRQPGCSPILGGARLPYGKKIRQGGPAIEPTISDSQKGFYHYHMYSFPLLNMLKLFSVTECASGGFIDFGLMYPSELDPTFNNDELAFFTHPESAIVSNAAAVTSCAIDGAAASFGFPINSMFWCAGTWGTLYPFSGTVKGVNFAIDTSLVATKGLAALHRRGLAWKTMGSDAYCDGKIWPTLLKSQYKMTFFSPVPEAKKSHRIGQIEFPWSSGRMIPGAGEDATIIIFRYNDCCMVL